MVNKISKMLFSDS